MHGQPEAGRDMGQGLLFAERQHDPGNRFTYPFNHLMGARQIGIGEQDQEFLTAPTAARVVFADIGSNDLGNHARRDDGRDLDQRRVVAVNIQSFNPRPS